MKQSQNKNLVLASLFSAIIFVTTAYIFHIPTSQGYVHIGDAFIYLAGSLLPTPYAIASSAIGASLSDGLTGYPMWIIPSVIIKSLTALVFTSKSAKIICKRNIISFVPALIFCTFGYYISEVIMFQNFIAPLSSIPANCIQVSVSFIIYALCGTALDKANVKKLVNAH